MTSNTGLSRSNIVRVLLIFFSRSGLFHGDIIQMPLDLISV
ncbi:MULTISPECIES: hypothetical protein [unclassified Microcoleus]